jgi:linoleoyl-CoA desaturase
MTAPRVTFVDSPSTPSILTELRAAAAARLSETGRSRKANAAMVVRTIVLLGVTFGAYSVILAGGLPGWAKLGLAMVVGVGVAGIGFGIAHDALHGAYSSNPRVNRLLGYTFDLCGASSYLWNHGHNVAHHTYTNIDGHDGDVASSSLLRKSPDAPHQPHHRYQHLYGFPLYSLATLNWVFVKDYKDLLLGAGAPGGKGHRAADVAALLAGKAVYYAWSLVIPLMVLAQPWWQVLIGYLAMHLTAGLILGLVFQLAHLVEGMEFPTPDAEGTVSRGWVEHELATTANFANGNRLLTWYVGGLNHQIEHHLFPRVCSMHYPALRPIVVDAARRYGLVYHHQPTVVAAIRSHYRFLKRMGGGERPDALASAANTSAAPPAVPLAS